MQTEINDFFRIFPISGPQKFRFSKNFFLLDFKNLTQENNLTIKIDLKRLNLTEIYAFKEGYQNFFKKSFSFFLAFFTFFVIILPVKIAKSKPTLILKKRSSTTTK
jgi:hypothetical protein